MSRYRAIINHYAFLIFTKYNTLNINTTAYNY